MLNTEIFKSLEKMTNNERLEVIEIASQLIRKEINAKNDNLSVEVKAWQRINSKTEDNQWIIVDNIDEEIDLEKIKSDITRKKSFPQNGIIAQLTINPLKIPDFQPLTREEAHIYLNFI